MGASQSCGDGPAVVGSGKPNLFLGITFGSVLGAAMAVLARVVRRERSVS